MPMVSLAQKSAIQHEGSACLGCSDDRIPLGSHICWFYRSPAEREAVIFPFLKAGIETQEHCHYMLEEPEHHWLKTGLQRHGVDVAAVISSGQLSISDPAGLYGSEEEFDLGKNSRIWDEIYTDSHSDSYKMLRLVKDMSWMARLMLKEEMLLEYEIGLNYHLRKKQGLAICQYDLTKFKGDIVLDILKVHPIIIWGGMAVRNPFYVEPVVLQAQNAKH